MYRIKSLADFETPIHVAVMFSLSATSKMIYASANVMNTLEKTTVFYEYFYL
jgi:hypothetical protein